MATSANSFGSILGKIVTNQNVLTTAATVSLLDRTHYSSSGTSGHSGGGYYHHHGSGKKKKRSIALTALTLLSFLFFLNILQNCIQEHMNQMNPTMMVMQMDTTAATVRMSDRKGDEGEELFANTSMLEKKMDHHVQQNSKRNKKNSSKKNDAAEKESNRPVKRIDEVEKEVTIDVLENDNDDKVPKVHRKRINNHNGERNKGSSTSNIKISPTKPSWFINEGEYQYTQIPIKLKTVERYKKKF